MAYIGKQPTVGNFVKLDAIVTSATTTFNLLNGGVAYYPQSANNCIVSLNGVIQSPTSAYTISGSTIVFSDALTSSDVIDFILVLGDVLSIGTPSDGTVTNAKIAASTIDLTTKVTGTLPVANGGTGLTALGSSLQVLRTNTGATALEYATLSTGATAGQVIQVVSATDSTSRNTTSTSFVTASNTLSVAITPASASNKILIIVGSAGNGADAGYYTIYRGATNLGSSTGMSVNGNVAGGTTGGVGMNYLDSPATTSSTTYQVYIRTNTSSAAVTLNADNVKGSITCLEIKG